MVVHTLGQALFKTTTAASTSSQHKLHHKHVFQQLVKTKHTAAKKLFGFACFRKATKQKPSSMLDRLKNGLARKDVAAHCGLPKALAIWSKLATLEHNLGWGLNFVTTSASPEGVAGQQPEPHV